MKLTLALKGEYFDAIRDGSKVEEYRLANEYWAKRLIIGGMHGVLKPTFPHSNATIKNFDISPKTF